MNNYNHATNYTQRFSKNKLQCTQLANYHVMSIEIGKQKKRTNQSNLELFLKKLAWFAKRVGTIIHVEKVLKKII